MRQKSFTRHLPHYLPLIGIFTAATLAFLIFSFDKYFQASVAISVAVAHVTWGIIHHLIHRDLTVGIVLEYIAISILGLVVIFVVLF